MGLPLILRELSQESEIILLREIPNECYRMVT